MTYRSADELQDGLDAIGQSPKESGRLELIVRRPEVNRREVLDEARIDVDSGVVGDTWQVRGSPSMPDGSSNPLRQVTVMNSRAAALIAVSADRWELAGDQLYVDLDIGEHNAPAGTRMQIGDAVIEITDQPHLGCRKFAERFGVDALAFVNSDTGKKLRLRGANARVVIGGRIRWGDDVVKLP